jgi:hypothetical protein
MPRGYVVLKKNFFSVKKDLFACCILLHQGSPIHKFFADFKSFVTKNQALLNVAIPSLVTSILLYVLLFTALAWLLPIMSISSA